jgi:hypothetical protein
MRRQRRRELARSALLAAAITSCCLATLVGCLMACSLLRWPDLPSVIASVLTSTAITTAMILLVSPRNGR